MCFSGSEEKTNVHVCLSTETEGKFGNVITSSVSPVNGSNAHVVRQTLGGATAGALGLTGVDSGNRSLRERLPLPRRPPCGAASASPSSEARPLPAGPWAPPSSPTQKRRRNAIQTWPTATVATPFLSTDGAVSRGLAEQGRGSPSAGQHHTATRGVTWPCQTWN